MTYQEFKQGERFTVWGKEFTLGALDAKQRFTADILAKIGYSDKTQMVRISYSKISEDIYVLRDSERYPCFDSSDYAYEDRYYRYYYFCRSLEEVKTLGVRIRETWNKLGYQTPIVFAHDSREKAGFRLYME